MNELLWRLNTEGGEVLNLPQEEIEKLDAILAEALRTPGRLDEEVNCPFCGGNPVYRYANGVSHCDDCETSWIDDEDFQRLTESEEARAARLAIEHQRAHSEPMFDLTPEPRSSTIDNNEERP